MSILINLPKICSEGIMIRITNWIGILIQITKKSSDLRTKIIPGS